MSVDNTVLIENALQTLLDANEKVSVSVVAAKAKLSKSLVYKCHPDLVTKINEAKERQLLDMGARVSIEKALQELLDENEKVSVNKVSAKAGFYSSKITKRYPDLAFKINQAKENQSLDVDPRDQIERALHELLNVNEKINISRVATKAGFSSALIYNRYPDLAFIINEAKENQEHGNDFIDEICETEKLKKQIVLLKNKTAESKEVAESIKKQNEHLWEHIQQVYGMYDQILAERNVFAERLKHHQ